MADNGDVNLDDAAQSDGSGNSDYHSEYDSDMETINSTNYQFRYDGDRRFHGIEGNNYYLPNDHPEFERLDVINTHMRTMWGSNILAPISPKPSLILDVGTGSGSWVIEVAGIYSTAQVIGMDLSPIQPLSVPPNAEFQVGDLTVDLGSFHEMSFDLIHSRLVKLGVLDWQWDHYVEQVFQLLKPSIGWAQFGESSQLLCDGEPIPSNRPLYWFVKFLQEHRERTRTVDGGEHIEQRMKNAGFIDVQRFEKTIYYGDWNHDEELGHVWRETKKVFSGTVEPIVVSCFKRQLPDLRLREKFARDAVHDFLTHDYHLYRTMHMVIGRRPDKPLDL